MVCFGGPPRHTSKAQVFGSLVEQYHENFKAKLPLGLEDLSTIDRSLFWEDGRVVMNFSDEELTVLISNTVRQKLCVFFWGVVRGQSPELLRNF